MYTDIQVKVLGITEKQFCFQNKALLKNDCSENKKWPNLYQQTKERKQNQKSEEPNSTNLITVKKIQYILTSLGITEIQKIKIISNHKLQ